MAKQDQQKWGIDLGGTKIEGVVIREGDSPQVDCRIRVPTEGDKGYSHVISQIKKLIGMMAKEVGHHPEYIGIGTPGTTDPATGLMKNCNSTHLNNRPLQKDLETALGIPVAMAGYLMETKGSPESGGTTFLTVLAAHATVAKRAVLKR